MWDLRATALAAWRHLPVILGCGLLGLALGGASRLALARHSPASTSVRLTLSFPGLATGSYPDDSKFGPGDLIAPDVVAAALKEKRLDASPAFQTEVLASLHVEGIFPLDFIRARDRARVFGSPAPIYVPDEYALSLTPPADFPLSDPQRQILLAGIADAYRDKVQRVYVGVRVPFGHALDVLDRAEYSEYERILTDEVKVIVAYLSQQSAQAGNFRSPTTDQSFDDLLQRTKLFSELTVDKTATFIRRNALHRDQAMAVAKIDEAIENLQNQEAESAAEEKLVQDLLDKAASRPTSYMLAARAPAGSPRWDPIVVDQSTIDSLMAMDSYNSLMRKALDTGLQTLRLDAAKSQLVEQRNTVQAFLRSGSGEQAAVMGRLQKYLGALQAEYRDLIGAIEKTQVDFVHQQVAGVVRISSNFETADNLRPALKASTIGFILGLAAGAGLSLVRVGMAGSKGFLGRSGPPSSSGR